MIGVLGLCPGLVDRLPGEVVRVKRRVLRAWVIGADGGRLMRAGESGRKGGGGHGALGVGRRFAFGVPAWEEAPVIHPVARGGPECRAVLGGSINPTAVLIDAEKEARHRSELARACTSRRGERESGSKSPGKRRSVTPGTGVALRVASNLRNPSRPEDPDEQRAADRR